MAYRPNFTFYDVGKNFQAPDVAGAYARGRALKTANRAAELQNQMLEARAEALPQQLEQQATNARLQQSVLEEQLKLAPYQEQTAKIRTEMAGMEMELAKNRLTDEILSDYSELPEELRADAWPEVYDKAKGIVGEDGLRQGGWSRDVPPDAERLLIARGNTDRAGQDLISTTKRNVAELRSTARLLREAGAPNAAAELEAEADSYEALLADRIRDERNPLLAQERAIVGAKLTAMGESGQTWAGAADTPGLQDQISEAYFLLDSDARERLARDYPELVPYSEQTVPGGSKGSKEARQVREDYDKTLAALDKIASMERKVGKTTTGAVGKVRQFGEVIADIFGPEGQELTASELSLDAQWLKSQNYKDVVGYGPISAGDYVFLEQLFSVDSLLDSPGKVRNKLGRLLGIMKTNLQALNDLNSEAYPIPERFNAIMDIDDADLAKLEGGSGNPYKPPGNFGNDPRAMGNWLRSMPAGSYIALPKHGLVVTDGKGGIFSADKPMKTQDEWHEEPPETMFRTPAPPAETGYVTDEPTFQDRRAAFTEQAGTPPAWMRSIADWASGVGSKEEARPIIQARLRAEGLSGRQLRDETNRLMNRWPFDAEAVAGAQ